jgi:uncharacterized protein
MKNFLIFKWHVISILLFLSLTSYAQNAIQIKGVYDKESQIRLRWAPPTYKQLKHARQYGFEIEKTKISEQGNPVPLDEQVVEIITVMPYTSTDQWESSNVSSEDANVARELMTDFGYKADEESTPVPYDQITDKKLVHAVQNHETLKNQFAYTLLLADRSMDIAIGLGLAYIDGNIEGNSVYKYRINLGNLVEYISQYSELDFDAGIAEINTNLESNALPVPHTLTAEPSDKKVRLSWSISGFENVYSFFNIYRSENNGAFVRVNQNPYVFMSQDESAVIVSYKDSIPQNGIPYTYRVRGLSPFGGEGPYSDPVTVTGVPDPLPLAIEIKKIETIDDSLVIVWETYSKKDSLPPVLSTITGYEIVHSADLKAPPVLAKRINGSNIKTGTLANAADGYYFVEAIDSFGYRYPSVPHLFQGVDSIAPSQPSGLTAELKADGTARLRWQASTEADLAGYRVFYSYHPDGPYTQMTSENVTATEYVTKSLTDNANAKVYYKIKAIDKRDNTSLLSDQALLILPDVSGPSKPVLSHALPRPEGIRIGWSLSKDDDLDRHVLQRRVSEAVEWTDIVTISQGASYPALPITPAEVNPSRYVDTTKLQLRYYEYRLEAYDSTGNSSVSDIITIKPYDDGNRGEIRTFEAVIVKKMDDYIPNVPMQGTSGISQSNLSNTNIGVNNQGLVQGAMKSNGLVAKLNWEYNTAFPSSLETFSIYQKTSPPPLPGRPSEVPQTPFVLIKTVSAQQASQIAILNHGNGYMFFIEGLNPSKLINPVNNPSNKKIESPVILDTYLYKVIANHKVGGKSTESVTSLTK